MIGSLINWAIACWEIRSPISEKLYKLKQLIEGVEAISFKYLLSVWTSNQTVWLEDESKLKYLYVNLHDCSITSKLFTIYTDQV